LGKRTSVQALVVRDIDRDRFMTPQEAIEYGLIDAIMGPRGATVAGD
jgi:ATP-dependent protease ClpP protease subunit